jgi:archaellum component FlaC
LAEFATEHLTKVYCSIKNLDTCSDEEKTMINDLRSKTKEELDAIVATTAELTTAASEKYDKAIEELQATYESVTEEFHTESENIRKESNIKWVNQILAADFPTAADGAADEL